MSVKKQKCDCNDQKCCCGLQAKCMEHIAILCCNKATYHVLCISNLKKCPNCKQSFDEKTIHAIKHAETLIMRKYDEIQKIQRQQDKERKILQKKVNLMIHLIK